MEFLKGIDTLSEAVIAVGVVTVAILLVKPLKTAVSGVGGDTGEKAQREMLEAIILLRTAVGAQTEQFEKNNVLFERTLGAMSEMGHILERSLGVQSEIRQIQQNLHTEVVRQTPIMRGE